MSTNKPKLAFVLPEYALDTHFRYVGEFAHALAQQVDVFLVLEKGVVPPDFPRGKIWAQRRTFPPLRFFEMGWILLRLHLRGYRTQYVHYSFVAGFWSALWTKILGGSMYYWNCGMPWLYKRNIAREWFERLVFRIIDHLLTGADALHPGYATYYGIARERIFTLPNWVDVSGMRMKYAQVDKVRVRERYHIPQDAEILLFVHRLARRKGADLLPEIFTTLHKANSNRVLIIAGDGPERARMEQVFRERGLLNDIRMLGSVPGEIVSELYAIADIYLLPSEEEGFPHVLTEAQSIGLPYVATDVGGVREMTPSEGYRAIVKFGDVAAFTHAVEQLLQNTNERGDLSNVLKTWVMQYDKPVILARFIALVFPK